MEKSDHKLNRIISDWIFPIFISPLYKESCQLYIFKLLQTMIKDFANRKLSIWTTLAQTTWTYFWSCTHMYEENNCLCDSLHDFKKNKMCSKSKYKHLLDVAKSFWCRCCFIFDKFITFFLFWKCNHSLKYYMENMIPLNTYVYLVVCILQRILLL